MFDKDGLFWICKLEEVCFVYPISRLCLTVESAASIKFWPGGFTSAEERLLERTCRTVEDRLRTSAIYQNVLHGSACEDMAIEEKIAWSLQHDEPIMKTSISVPLRRAIDVSHQRRYIRSAISDLTYTVFQHYGRPSEQHISVHCVEPPNLVSSP